MTMQNADIVNHKTFIPIKSEFVRKHVQHSNKFSVTMSGWNKARKSKKKKI